MVSSYCLGVSPDFVEGQSHDAYRGESAGDFRRAPRARKFIKPSRRPTLGEGLFPFAQTATVGASPPPREGGAGHAIDLASSPVPTRQPPKLLDCLRRAFCSWQYSRLSGVAQAGRAQKSYCHWGYLPRRKRVKRFIFFHPVRQPVDMAESEINAFLRTRCGATAPCHVRYTDPHNAP